MEQESLSYLQFGDDFYLSALSNENEDQMFPESDAEYAEVLQLQDALLESLITSQISNSAAAAAPLTTKKVGESSRSFCEICKENKQNDEMFRIDSCSHSFCSHCIIQHVTVKIQENKSVVPCPGCDCRGALFLDACRSILPAEVIARWEDLLCESTIPPSEKFYCPFSGCSAMLINDGDVERIKECECPACHRLFCATCHVPWHAGIECEEFERLNEDERGREDLLVRELARSNSWMRCPHCKFYVEKTEGCLHMNCRCGLQFCYGCGATWTQNHGNCQTQ